MFANFAYQKLLECKNGLCQIFSEFGISKESGMQNLKNEKKLYGVPCYDSATIILGCLSFEILLNCNIRAINGVRYLVKGYCPVFAHGVFDFIVYLGL